MHLTTLWNKCLQTNDETMKCDKLDLNRNAMDKAEKEWMGISAHTIKYSN